MNILLLSMPDSFEHMPTVAIRMPNAALTSLAGNIDPHHEVAVADLILVQARVRQTVERLVREINPDVLGLSVMTFQRKTAKRIVDLVRSLRADVRVVVGGYDPSLAPEAYTDPSQGAVDFIVRGEGEITFRELLRAIENQSGYDRISGLSYRSGDRFSHNPDRPISDLESGEVRLPNRDARVLRGYTTLGRQADVIETSRAARSIAASARLSRCGAGTSIPILLTGLLRISATPVTTARGPSSSSMTISCSMCGGLRPSAGRSSMPDSTRSTTRYRR